jgi:hypothetical protein
MNLLEKNGTVMFPILQERIPNLVGNNVARQREYICGVAGFFNLRVLN